MSAKNTYNHEDDDDFDDLDDVLDEFDDEVLSQPPGATMNSQQHIAVSGTTAPISGESSINRIDVKIGQTGQQLGTSSPGGEDESSLDIDREMEKNFQNLLKEMASEDPELQGELKELLSKINGSEVDGNVATNSKSSTTAAAEEESEKPKNFQDVMKETMSRLKTSGDKVDQEIKEEQPDELISQLLQSLNLGDLQLGEGEGGLDGISRLLSEMLDQLSSKQVLYEPLNDLYSKFPEWLNNNSNDENIQNYTNQYKLIDEIMTKFNDTNYNDSDKQDKEYISARLEKLQELGMPPKEIMNEDLSALPAFGGAGSNSGNDGIGNLFGSNGDDFQLNPDDIPEDLGKELEETCKQT